jgi:cell division septation protein DedD
VPEFNFAKGNTRTPKDLDSTETPRISETGRPRPVSAHQADELPFELHEPPRRESAASPPAGTAATHSAPAVGEQSGSVLDKYPKRDFSHLTDPAAIQNSPAAVPTGVPDPADSASPTSETSQEEITMPGTADQSRRSTSRTPLIVIGSVVIFLVLLAFIWHLNPYPPLKDAISGFFSRKAVETTAIPSTTPARDDDDGNNDATLRSWDYYLQVSSWKELVKADQEAERFRSQGLDVAVESEPIPTRGGTYYRVRLGPYESAEAAYAAAAGSPGIVPADAFLDSVRLSEDVPVANPKPAQSRPMKQRASASREDQSGNDDLTRWRKDFGVVDEPLSGYAVQVSSLRSVDVARVEARKMVEQGYPAFITRAKVGTSSWYRVLVGPFNSRSDADKYARLINVTFGNEAYTIDLSRK